VPRPKLVSTSFESRAILVFRINKAKSVGPKLRREFDSRYPHKKERSDCFYAGRVRKLLCVCRESNGGAMFFQ